MSYKKYTNYLFISVTQIFFKQLHYIHDCLSPSKYTFPSFFFNSTFTTLDLVPFVEEIPLSTPLLYLHFYRSSRTILSAVSLHFSWVAGFWEWSKHWVEHHCKPHPQQIFFCSLNYRIINEPPWRMLPVFPSWWLVRVMRSEMNPHANTSRWRYCYPSSSNN